MAAPSRNNDARQRLLDAATQVFAENGFDGASTRAIVRKAGVNISAIPYYFTSKDGLYEAVIRNIIAIIHDEARNKAEEIRHALDAGDLTGTHARRLLHDFINLFIDFLLSSRASPHMAQIIIREQMRPTAAFELLYQAMGPIHETMTRLIGLLIERPATDQQTILCTNLIFGQLMIFKTHKAFILRRTGWPDYHDDQTRLITSTLIRAADAIIDAFGKQPS